MMDLNICGDIINNDYEWIYNYLDMECVTPAKVKDVISKCKNNETLNVYINSGGGDVFAGAEIYTLLSNYNNVKIQIVGLAGSMASIIAMSGYCEMSPVSQMMVHNVMSNAHGNYLDMEHKADVLRNASETIANAYIKKSGMSKEEIKSLMDNETWLSPERALELHLIDKISDFNNNNTISMVASSGMSISNEFIKKMNDKRIKATMELNLLKLKGETL